MCVVGVVAVRVVGVVALCGWSCSSVWLEL